MRIYEINEQPFKSKNMINIFHPHKKIGIDIDDTLIGNNAFKSYLQKYIIDYHLEKDFYINRHLKTRGSSDFTDTR